jgi:hypothetical protein
MIARSVHDRPDLAGNAPDRRSAGHVIAPARSPALSDGIRADAVITHGRQRRQNP